MSRKNTIITAIFVILLITIGAYMHYNPHSCARRIVKSLETDSIDSFKECVKKNKTGINSSYFADVFTLVAERNYCPIHYAALLDDCEKVKVLIDNGAEIDKLDPTVQRTALMFALKSRNKYRYRMARLFVENGANVFFEDKHGYSIIEESCVLTTNDDEKTQNEGAEFFKELAEKTGYGKTYFLENPVLVAASYYGNEEVVKYLIKNKLDDINATDETGWTPLIAAVKCDPFDENQEEIVKYLLKNGADKDMRDSDGKTAYDYAVQLKNERIISLLEEN